MPSIDRTTPSAIPSDVATLARDYTAFALDLYEQLRGAEGNLAFSPYSVAATLGVLYAGADKETASQIADALRSSLPPDRLHHAAAALSGVLQQIAQRGEVRLSSANGLFPQERYPLLPAFLALTKEYHGVSVTPLDYGKPKEARRRMNSWVEERTERRITDLIPKGAIETLTRLVAVNAVYFKGSWLEQFDPTDTREAPFWLTPDRKVDVATMHQRAHFRLVQTDRVKVLELPYSDSNLSMLVILPEARDGLAEVEARLSPSTFSQWTANSVYGEVRVRLPRFRVEGGVSLNPVLQSLGMVDAFDRDRADFSRMDGRTRWLFVSLMVHKAFVEVNEEGTEAAAASGGMVFSRSLSRPQEFCADHPFLFAMVERQTGTILFLGRVVDPRAGGAAGGAALRKGVARLLGRVSRSD